MTTKLVEVKRQWEQLVFAYRFMQIVKAPDGDMGSIGRLAKASNDAYSLRLLVEFLSRYPQGRLAFQERPRLGKVDLQQLHQLQNKEQSPRLSSVGRSRRHF